TIKKYSMLVGEEKILIGLSGGPDSVCLLYVLNDLKDKFMLDLHAMYIDHLLRPGETDIEIELCKNLCEKLKVPFITKSIDVKSYAKKQGINRQEAARELRYRIFEEIAYEINANKIALGHTADDHAETLLMRLFRGSGPTGLSGIPPVRGNIIRPLIEIERKEIEGFLDEGKIDYIVDSSNLKKDYLRNKIRLSLIPMLREFNPDIIETLSKTAAIFREEERYFEIIVAKTLMKLISRKTDTRIELFLVPFEIMDKVIMRRVLRKTIEETKGLRGVSFIHIENIIELIKNGKPGDRLYLPKGIRVIKEYSTLVLTSEPPVKLNTYTFAVPGEIVLKEAGILIRASIVGSQESEVMGHDSRLWTTLGIFDADRLTFPLIIRPRKNGDFFCPLGFGKRRKLQDFFVDEKVPRDERDKIPLIISGKDIVWVVGYRGDERFKVIEETKRVLKLEVKRI
ncbi:MAG: tRNA lysidine(34) synthetase TilS, partial [Nitrospirota bacterium]